ncbi:hypothetical protein JOJ86_006029 [Rhodococcus percolatus]|uniref:terminase large subunit domain-containing protein n=1 Tax=Rhodococcus opacus TaxID=37919 RepID=UPI0015FDCBB5|nr:terminase family protein [Rhodococcus opacus]MBA8964751.1 hypothetical protein [Rhodococcus opacus]MBP2208303.1 hypothetical protein [Rhodococcus opacus]
MTAVPTFESLARTQHDPAAFAEEILGYPLFDYQAEVARSKARYRNLCCGRQIGKSTVMAVIALHRAFTRPGSEIVIVSANDNSAKRLLRTCSKLAAKSGLTRGSIGDDHTTEMNLTNGSRIVAVPCSEGRVRGDTTDLLIIDEAALVPNEVWEGAEPALITRFREGAQVLLSSTPGGGPSHFFRRKWQEGMTSPSDKVMSWHWPTSISPLVSDEDLEDLRKSKTPEVFNREYLAEWQDFAGSFFTEAEISNAVADYEYTTDKSDLTHRRNQLAVAGLDWGKSVDSNVLVLLSVLDNVDDPTRSDDLCYYLPHIESHKRLAYSEFANRIVDVAKHYRIRTVVSELNGVGAPATEMLEARIREQRHQLMYRTRVEGVHTTNRHKQDRFGNLKLLMQQHRIALPNNPELLDQLRALERTTTEHGNVKIAVPETAGHDDAALSLAQATAKINPRRSTHNWAGSGGINYHATQPETVETPGGLRIPRNPKALDYAYALSAKRKSEDIDEY